MGAFELMDMIGHDVNYAVTSSVYDAFHQDPRFTPSLLQKELVDAGWLGRKSGRGFYDYAGPAAAVVDATPAPAPVGVVFEGDLGVGSALLELARATGVAVDCVSGSGSLRMDGVRVALTDGRTATERSAGSDLPVVLFDLALDYAGCTRIALAPADQASAEQVALVAGFFQKLGKAVSVIDDAPGMVVMRTVAMLANEAADAVHQGIASAHDVDLAMRKGVNYPLGPLAWVDAIGLPAICVVLANMGAYYGEERYRISPRLRRRALAGGRLAA
jgi:3-hydroxybutyryl-CoA dehydrogenase